MAVLDSPIPNNYCPGILLSRYAIFIHIIVRDITFGPKLFRLASKRDKSRCVFFQIILHFILAQRELISDLKSTGFVLFGVNLTYFRAKSDIPGHDSMSHMTSYNLKIWTNLRHFKDQFSVYFGSPTKTQILSYYTYIFVYVP